MVESFSYSDHFMVKFELSINCHEYKGLARSYVYDFDKCNSAAITESLLNYPFCALHPTGSANEA